MIKRNATMNNARLRLVSSAISKSLVSRVQRKHALLTRLTIVPLSNWIVNEPSNNARRI